MDHAEILEKLNSVTPHTCDNMDKATVAILEILRYEYREKKIKFKYTNDEYGVAARVLHHKCGLKYAYDGDAGLDLPIVLSAETQEHGQVIWPGEREILHTGVIMEFPVGYWGRIIHRSSTERKSRLRVIEGVIDDYRGEILIQVHNGNTSQAKVYHGNRLAQLIVHKTCSFICEPADELRPSNRGAKGFGSSGT